MTTELETLRTLAADVKAEAEKSYGKALERAEKDLRMAVERAPHDCFAWAELGGVLKEKGDTKGTKKDISFLRCPSNCVSDCTKIGTSGIPKDRDECLIECQDECCSTYEQCTYTIRG